MYPIPSVGCHRDVCPKGIWALRGDHPCIDQALLTPKIFNTQYALGPLALSLVTTEPSALLQLFIFLLENHFAQDTETHGGKRM